MKLTEIPDTPSVQFRLGKRPTVSSPLQREGCLGHSECGYPDDKNKMWTVDSKAVLGVGLTLISNLALKLYN